MGESWISMGNVIKLSSISATITTLELPLDGEYINELEYAINLLKANISTQNNTLKVEFTNIKHCFSQKTRFELEKIKSKDDQS